MDVIQLHKLVCIIPLPRPPPWHYIFRSIYDILSCECFTFYFLFFYQYLVFPQVFLNDKYCSSKHPCVVSGCPVREQGMFLEAGLLGWRVETVLVFITCCQIAMKSAWTGLYSHQQCMDVLFSSYPCPKLILSDFKSLASWGMEACFILMVPGIKEKLALQTFL